MVGPAPQQRATHVEVPEDPLHADRRAPFLATQSLLPIVAALRRHRRHRCGNARHLAGRAHPVASLPEALEHRKTRDAPRRTRQARHHAGRQHHQAAEHQRVGAAAEGRDRELQQHGFALPDYPEEPQARAQDDIKARYDRTKGSAVNPVLREGNSDRRAPLSVKHTRASTRTAWASGAAIRSRTSPHMDDGDFYGSERSATIAQAGAVCASSSSVPTAARTCSRRTVKVQAGELVDGAVMSAKALARFVDAQIEDASAQGVLFSLHLKATMMKVSDPIMFGFVVERFYRDVLAGHARRAGAGRLRRQQRHRRPVRAPAVAAGRPCASAIEADIVRRVHAPSGAGDGQLRQGHHQPARAERRDRRRLDAGDDPRLGRMWNADGKLQDTKAVIPDRCYAGIYQAVIDDCKAHGAFDPATMGSVPNVGLMAQKAEEYGSHDKTFQIPPTAPCAWSTKRATCVFEHAVEAGDIWRMCQTKDAPIRDWVQARG
jgi:isocitrate dehydrogenase